MSTTTDSRHRGLPLILLLVTLVVLLWSGINPTDRLTWIMEVAPVLIALPILLSTAQRFPLTPLLYILIFLFGLYFFHPQKRFSKSVRNFIGGKEHQ